MNQGKKVFDGTLAEARRAQSWVRLRTSDLGAAVAELRAAKLVVAERDDGAIALAEGAATSDVVRRLVELGFPVHEIATEKPTLEDFYLSLMRQGTPDAGRRTAEA